MRVLGTSNLKRVLLYSLNFRGKKVYLSFEKWFKLVPTHCSFSAMDDLVIEKVKHSSGTSNVVVFMWWASFILNIHTSHGSLSYFPIMSSSLSIYLS